MKDSREQRVGTSAVIVRSDKSILFVKRSETDTFLPGIWELPGGGTEFNELPQEAVKREVQEECGVSIVVYYPLFAFSYQKEDKHVVDIAFLCKLQDEFLEITLSGEHSEFAWHSLSNLPLTISDSLRFEFKRLESHPFWING